MFKGKHVTIEENVTIGKHVVLEDDVYIERGTIIYDHVTIKKGTFIGAYSILGEHLADYYQNKDSVGGESAELIIGEQCIIRSNTIIYGKVQIGDFFQTGHRVTIRERTKIGHHVRIGTNSDIQDNVIIGNHVNIHSDVFISAGNILHDYVWICPRVLFANDYTPPSNEIKGSEVESFSTICSNVTVLPGTTIQQNVLVAAGAVVGGVAESGWTYAGIPAKKVKAITDIKNHITGEEAYPWQFHFDRGMPWENVGYKDWSSQ